MGFTMNEHLNLVEILKDCPKGTKLYLTTLGEVEFCQIDSGILPIRIKHKEVGDVCLTQEGKAYKTFGGECILFPSRGQRDWSKFKLKKDKFDPKTLKPFDKVLVKDRIGECYHWLSTFFSYYDESESLYPCRCAGAPFSVCIPYNEETKHLVGTDFEAPEYYRYWED